MEKNSTKNNGSQRIQLVNNELNGEEHSIQTWNTKHSNHPSKIRNWNNLKNQSKKKKEWMSG
jgi:hypothetical protein